MRVLPEGVVCIEVQTTVEALESPVTSSPLPVSVYIDDHIGMGHHICCIHQHMEDHLEGHNAPALKKLDLLPKPRKKILDLLVDRQAGVHYMPATKMEKIQTRSEELWKKQRETLRELSQVAGLLESCLLACAAIRLFNRELNHMVAHGAGGNGQGWDIPMEWRPGAKWNSAYCGTCYHTCMVEHIPHIPPTQPGLPSSYGGSTSPTRTVGHKGMTFPCSGGGLLRKPSST